MNFRQRRRSWSKPVLMSSISISDVRQKKRPGRCRGGYHLGQPDVAIEIVRRVRDAVPSETPVTVKMRRGLDDTQQSRDNFFRIMETAFDLGIAAITVHGRTVEQKYVGPSRWEFLKEVRQQFPDRTLLGSGDLFTAADCVRMLQETGVDGVTAARGSIGNPWIFSQAAALLRGEPMPQPPTVHEQRDVICEHFRLAEQILPPDQVSKQLRKFCIHYSAWHPAADTVRAAFIGVQKCRRLASRDFPPLRRRTCRNVSRRSRQLRPGTGSFLWVRPFEQ